MDGLPCMIAKIGQFMDLRMTIMASRDAVVGPGRKNLIRFYFAVSFAGIRISGLEESTAAAATEIIRPIGCHVDEVFLSHDRFNHKAKIFRDGISVAFTHDLARVLDCKLYFQFLVPIGIDRKLALPDPFCIIFIYVFNLEIMFNIEFFQSCQDREGNVPSFRIEKNFASQIGGLFG
jgi:hypothetical protein